MGDSYNAKMVCFGIEVCTHEKAVFFLPVNILTVWSPAFLAARHTTVCLDLIKNSQAVKKGVAPKKVNDFKTLLDRHYSNCLFYFV